MQELWQLYDPQGRLIPGQGASKNDIYGKGLLHAAAHVWLWRMTDHGPEVLLQKRASTKRTWPNRYDISAAGHLDLGEQPLQAALRETKEELNLTLDESDLELFAVRKVYLVAPTGEIENEFQWLYLVRLQSENNFGLEAREVASIEWKSVDDMEHETRQPGEQYVPHHRQYYDAVILAVRTAANERPQ